MESKWFPIVHNTEQNCVIGGLYCHGITTEYPLSVVCTCNRLTIV